MLWSGYVGIGIMFIGCALLSCNLRKYGVIVTGASVLMILGAVVSFFAWLGILGVIIAIYIPIAEYQKKKQEKMRAAKEAEELLRRQSLEIGGTDLDKFFVECVLNEYTDFSNAYIRQKAQYIAERYGLSYGNDISSLFEKAKKEHKIISQKTSQKMIKLLREQEHTEFDELNRYSELFGKNKRIQILSDLISKENARIMAITRYANAQYKADTCDMERERDWATWGGIAEGLGGVGAGVSTALEIQAENAQKRARNQQRESNAKQNYNRIMDRISYGEIDSLTKQIEHARQCVVSEHTPQEVLDMLNIKGEVQVSETGAYKVFAHVTTKNALYIFNNINAVADGTIIAHVYDGDRLIGSANMVIPVYGISRSKQLVGMGLTGAKVNEQYTLKFSAKNLWLMEE